MATFYVSRTKLSAQSLVTRTHLTNVISNDNITENRKLDLKLKQINVTKNRTSDFHVHQKKLFMSEMCKKSTRWEKEHHTFVKTLQLDRKTKCMSSRQTPTPQTPTLPRK